MSPKRLKEDKSKNFMLSSTCKQPQSFGWPKVAGWHRLIASPQDQDHDHDSCMAQRLEALASHKKQQQSHQANHSNSNSQDQTSRKPNFSIIYHNKTYPNSLYWMYLIAIASLFIQTAFIIIDSNNNGKIEASQLVASTSGHFRLVRHPRTTPPSGVCSTKGCQRSSTNSSSSSTTGTGRLAARFANYRHKLTHTHNSVAATKRSDTKISTIDIELDPDNMKISNRKQQTPESLLTSSSQVSLAKDSTQDAQAVPRLSASEHTVGKMVEFDSLRLPNPSAATRTRHSGDILVPSGGLSFYSLNDSFNSLPSPPKTINININNSNNQPARLPVNGFDQSQSPEAAEAPKLAKSNSNEWKPTSQGDPHELSFRQAPDRHPYRQHPAPLSNPKVLGHYYRHHDQQQPQPSAHSLWQPTHHQHQHHQEPQMTWRKPRINEYHKSPTGNPGKLYKRVLLCDKTLVSLDYIRRTSEHHPLLSQGSTMPLPVEMVYDSVDSNGNNNILDSFMDNSGDSFEAMAPFASKQVAVLGQPPTGVSHGTSNKQQWVPLVMVGSRANITQAEEALEPLQKAASQRLERRNSYSHHHNGVLSDEDPLVRCDMWDLEKGSKNRKPPLKLVRMAIKTDFDTVRDAINRCRQLSEKNLPSEDEYRDNMVDFVSTEDMISLFSIKRGLLPGTKWCGLGDQADHYNDLGSKHRIDICCRAHDHCPIRLKPFRNDYGILNLGLYTKSHCDCDADFYRCLREAHSKTADMLGNLYFNVMKLQCMREEPIKVCKEVKHIALGFERCLRYEEKPDKMVFRFTTPPVAY